MEHIVIDRVTERKSLVDIVMTAGVCQNHFAEGIDSFILVSSDSDFWGLITSLPNAKFLVMYEYANCGKAIKAALEEHDIYYCSIDVSVPATWMALSGLCFWASSTSI